MESHLRQIHAGDLTSNGLLYLHLAVMLGEGRGRATAAVPLPTAGGWASHRVTHRGSVGKSPGGQASVGGAHSLGPHSHSRPSSRPWYSPWRLGTPRDPVTTDLIPWEGAEGWFGPLVPPWATGPIGDCGALGGGSRPDLPGRWGGGAHLAAGSGNPGWQGATHRHQPDVFRILARQGGGGGGTGFPTPMPSFLLPVCN